MTEKNVAEKNQQEMFEEEEDDFEVEVVDDTPEEDRNRTPPKGASDEDEDEGDEAEQYSERVQKRIKKLKWEYHEERRKHEQALREHNAAVEYAKKVAEENEKLKKSLDESSEVVYDAHTSRTEAELAQARSDYKKAYEEGDTDSLIKAQEKISELVAQKSSLSSKKPKKAEEPSEQEQPKQQQGKGFQPQAPNPKTQRWFARNQWFHKEGYEDMTALAYGLHEKAIRKEGIEPETDEYFQYIDKGMHKAFPDQFEERKASSKRPPSRVAGAQRGGPKPRTYTLNASQAALAKRLGITPKQYAEQMMKDAEDG